MRKREDAPFHVSEYDTVRKLVSLKEPAEFWTDVRAGNCERMYDEIQRAYKGLGEDTLLVIPATNYNGLLGIYTRNLYDAYKHDYLPKGMTAELMVVMCKYLKAGYNSFPKVLDVYSVSRMHPELKAVVEKYMKVIHAGQVILSTEICEMRDSSWEECFDEPFRDVLLVLDI